MAIVYQMFPTFFYNGRPMSGGTISFYKNAQRNMTENAYSDAGGTAAGAFYTKNIDENGQIENLTQVYLDDTKSYYVEVKDSGGITRYTYQGLPAYNGGTVANNYYINPNLAPNPQFYQHKKTAVTAASVAGYSDKQEIAPPSWFFDQTASATQTATISFVTDTTADNAIGAQGDSTPAYNLKYNITGAGTSVSALRIYFEIPTVRALHNEAITISADVKGSSAYNINFFYQQNITGTAATQQTISTEAVTTSWSTVTGTATIADITGTIVDNGDYIIIGVDLTGLYASSSATFEMTNFQLYLGSTVIPYVYKTPAQSAVESIPTPNPDADDGKILRVNNSGYYELGYDATAKNKIWGGDFSMNPFQEGTSWSGNASGVNNPQGRFTQDTYIADGYEVIVTGTLGNTEFNGSKDSAAPTFADANYNTANSLRVGIEQTEGTPTALVRQDDTLITLRHVVEGYDAKELYGAGETATISFWVYAKNTGTFYLTIRNNADDRAYVKSYTISTTETWEYKQLIVPEIITGGATAFETTTNPGLVIDWVLAVGADYIDATIVDGTWENKSAKYAPAVANCLGTTTADDFQIALPVLNKGSGSITYPLVERNAVLRKAQRYLERSYPIGTIQGDTTSPSPGFAIGTALSATALGCTTRFNVPKRVDPAVAVTDIYSAYGGTQSKVAVISTSTGNASSEFANAFSGISRSIEGINGLSGSSGLTTAATYGFHWIADCRF